MLEEFILQKYRRRDAYINFLSIDVLIMSEIRTSRDYFNNKEICHATM